MWEKERNKRAEEKGKKFFSCYFFPNLFGDDDSIILVQNLMFLNLLEPFRRGREEEEETERKKKKQERERNECECFNPPYRLWWDAREIKCGKIISFHSLFLFFFLSFSLSFFPSLSDSSNFCPFSLRHIPHFWHVPPLNREQVWNVFHLSFLTNIFSFFSSPFSFFLFERE